MTRFVHIPKAAMIAAGVALGALAYAPSAQAFGGHGGGGGHFGGGGGHFGGGGFHGGFRGGGFGGGYGGYGGWGGWGIPISASAVGYPYDYDAADCALRRVHVHTVHGWRWRT